MTTNFHAVLLRDTVLEIEKKYTNDTAVSQAMLLQLVSIIQSSMNKFGKAELAYSVMAKKVGVSKTVIIKHIDWLLLNGIIMRNGLRFDGKLKRFYTYVYTLRHQDVESFDLFEFKIERNKDANEERLIECDTLAIPFHYVTVDIIGASQFLHSEFKQNKKSLSVCASQLSKLHNLHIGNIKVIKGKNVNRYFTFTTEVSSDMHQFMYINNNQVSEVDAKASQATLISFLTKYINSKFHTDIHEDIYTKLLNKLKIIKKPDDEIIIDYPEQKIINGRRKRPKFGLVQDVDRSTIKKIVYANFFSGFNLNDSISKLFNGMYPEIVNEINRIFKLKSFPTKKLAGKHLAQQLQNIESKIWIGAARELIKQGILVLTKHDSILCESKHLDTVIETVKKHYLLMEFNFDPKLNLKVEVRTHFQINDFKIKQYLNVRSYKEHHSYNKFNKHLLYFNGIEFKFTNKELCSVFSLSINSVYKMLSFDSNRFSIEKKTNCCYKLINKLNNKQTITIKQINNQIINSSINTLLYRTFRPTPNSKDSNTPIKTAPFSTEKYKFTLNDKSHKWTISEFMNKTGFIKQRVNDLLRGNKKQYKGWTVSKIEPKVNQKQLRADKNQQILEARHNILKIIDNSKWDSVLFDKEDTEKLFNSLNVIPYFKNRTEHVTKCDGFVVRSGCLVMFHDNFKQGIYTEIYSFKFKKLLEMHYVDTSDIEGICTIEEKLDSMKSPVEKLFRF